MILLPKMENFKAWCHCMKGQGQREGGQGGAKYLGPGLVGGGKILVKRLVMGVTVKRVGEPKCESHACPEARP